MSQSDDKTQFFQKTPECEKEERREKESYTHHLYVTGLSCLFTFSRERVWMILSPLLSIKRGEKKGFDNIYIYFERGGGNLPFEIKIDCC